MSGKVRSAAVKNKSCGATNRVISLTFQYLWLEEKLAL